MSARQQFWVILPLILGGLAAAETRAERLLRCESEDGRRRYCRADTRGGVRLERQLSRAPCRYNVSWGTIGRGSGCRTAAEGSFALRRAARLAGARRGSCAASPGRGDVSIVLRVPAAA
jgi:hypothetical protein